MKHKRDIRGTKTVMRSLQVKLIKMGGRIVHHARQIIFQVAEVAVPRDLFAAILEQITKLCLSPG